MARTWLVALVTMDLLAWWRLSTHPLSSVANARSNGPCQFGSPCPARLSTLLSHAARFVFFASCLAAWLPRGFMTFRCSFSIHTHQLCMASTLALRSDLVVGLFGTSSDSSTLAEFRAPRALAFLSLFLAAAASALDLANLCRRILAGVRSISHTAARLRLLCTPPASASFSTLARCPAHHPSLIPFPIPFPPPSSRFDYTSPSHCTFSTTLVLLALHNRSLGHPLYRSFQRSQPHQDQPWRQRSLTTRRFVFCRRRRGVRSKVVAVLDWPEPFAFLVAQPSSSFTQPPQHPRPAPTLLLAHLTPIGTGQALAIRPVALSHPLLQAFAHRVRRPQPPNRFRIRIRIHTS